jgi:hypothetical protein
VCLLQIEEMLTATPARQDVALPLNRNCGAPMAKWNRVLRVTLMGGLLGALFTNPRKALEAEILAANQQGWNAIHIQAHRTTNLFVLLLQIVVLILTLGLWTWGAGYLVLLEREDWSHESARRKPAP